SSNRWQWQSDPDKGYTVRGAFQLLTSQDAVTLDDAVTHKNKPGHPSASYHRRLTIVFLAVERSNRLNTCSSLAALSVPFGLLSVLGSALHR
ncbi:hypothetical protein A2U01_0062805, partial [Trifolium medium]|nr:hypothetical protein [Trifolium medium]